MDNIRNMPAIEEFSDQATTCVESSPSETSHSPSFFTEKTSVSSYPSRVPGSVSGVSEAALNALAIADDHPLNKGWPSLARQMAKKPHLESFCRFRELNVKNLLYYQVEIAEMEAELRKVERKDAGKCGQKEGTYATDPKKMLLLNPEDRRHSSPEERKQHDLVLKIRKCLREYNKALLRHAQISAMPQPDADHVNGLCEWIRRDGCGDDAIEGECASAWGDFNASKPHFSKPREILHSLGQLLGFRERIQKEDKKLIKKLVKTHPCKKSDTFTRWVEKDVVPFWNVCNSKRVDLEDKDFNEMKKNYQKRILNFTSFLATVVACVLPTVAIGILSTAKTKRDKLLYIGGFTTLFAIGLLLFTEPGTSRISVFMATATFSAVLVVFIQNG